MELDFLFFTLSVYGRQLFARNCVRGCVCFGLSGSRCCKAATTVSLPKWRQSATKVGFWCALTTTTNTALLAAKEPLFNENPTAHLSPSAVHWSVAYVVLPTSRPILYCYPVDQVGRRDNNANGPTRRTGWPHGDIRIRVDDDPAGPSLFHSFCHCPDVSPSLVHYLLSPTIFGSLDCSHPSLRAFASSTLSLCAPGCASPKTGARARQVANIRPARQQSGSFKLPVLHSFFLLAVYKAAVQQEVKNLKATRKFVVVVMSRRYLCSSTLSLSVIPEQGEYYDLTFFVEWANDIGDRTRDSNELDTWSLDRRPAKSSNRPCGFGTMPASQNVAQPSPLVTPSPGSRLANFFVRPFRSSALKRTKSFSKLDRKRSPFGLTASAPAAGDWYGCSKVRNSRSHDSLLVGSSQSTSAEGASLVRTVDLSKPGCSVVPVHASLLGTPHCYRVKSVGSDGSVLSSKYFACKTACERDRWIANLSRSMQPNRDQSKRLENSLQVWILEAKGVLAKRRYLCELSLDGQVQARTSSKLNANICFWGEQFVFTNLASLNGITIGLYRESERKKRKENRTSLIGHVDIPVNSLCSKYPVEKWYVICGHDKSASKGGEAISLRVKARFQSVTVLPLKVYVRLLQFLTENYLQLCLVLEPVLSVRAKEDFATSLVRIMHSQHLAKNFLCDLIMAEIEGLENDHLMFRGNSLATKAVEAYIKLIGEQYLHRTLASFVRTIQSSDEDCEVDPEKLSNRALIEKHQEALLTVVHSAWGRILNSFHDFPLELRLLFHEVRKRLADCGRGELADNLISSSVFLRFLCPAIMSPSLFNLIQEYPCGRTARNLTLVAKTVQTLANFNKFGGKEHYMEFMNRFVEGEWEHMRQFLRRISSPLCSSGLQSRSAAEWNGVIDLGKDLSLLHGFLAEVLPDANAKKRSWSMLPTLNSVVEEIGGAYCREDLSLVSSRSMDESNDSTTEGEKSRSYCLSTESSTSSESTGKPSMRNDEDCPWYTIIDENIGLRRMGLLVQQSRLSKHPDGYRQSADCSGACLQSRPQEAITASQLISGNSSSDIRFVDDASASGTEYHHTSTNAGEGFRTQRGLDGSEVSQASLCQTTVATSDYNSLSNSTNSPVGSTCSCSGGSSTADRRPNHSDSTVDFDESPVASSSQTHIPMAVSNPLYSLQQVPAVPCRSRDEVAGAIAHTDLISKRTPLICGGGDPTETAGRTSAHVDAHSTGKPLLPRTNPRFNGASFQHARAMSLSIPGVSGPLTRPPSTQNSVSHDATVQGSSSGDLNADLLHRSALIRELRELKQKLELSESRLQMAEQRERSWKQMYDERIPVWSEQVRPVFNRLREVEEELQQEINASIQKQMIIEKQRERIHSLVAANERLLSMFQQKDNCQELMALTENLANALTPPESDDGGSQQRPVNKWDDATTLSNGMTNLGINGNGDGGSVDKCAGELLPGDFSQLKTTQC
ncbi:hypothetical protein M514_07456 [Trichuris suis]|uniref:Uncharacterized protein n=1 Tax=Trichuris suis TaxID=68888 RepID=A0A085NE25_9BILA|nr:hypothetical protein M514_07456 [Trichuris suis]